MVARPSPSISRTFSPSITPPGGRLTPGATFDPRVVTPADLRVLTNPRAFSGFSNVYAVECKTRWRARVEKRLNIGRNFQSPTLAACAVVRWYKTTYGPGWVEVFRKRKAQPWRVIKDRAGVYRVEVYLCGEPVPVGTCSTKAEAVKVARRASLPGAGWRW